MAGPSAALGAGAPGAIRGQGCGRLRKVHERCVWLARARAPRKSAKVHQELWQKPSSSAAIHRVGSALGGQLWGGLTVVGRVR